MNQLSSQGIKFIKRWEALRLTPYRDVARFWTVGYGHKCGTTCTDFEVPIDEILADALFVVDVAWIKMNVNELLQVVVTQYQLDALLSFTFNLGAWNLARSTLLRKLNQGDYLSVPTELAKWVNAGGRRIKGLINRRAAEIALWETGEYGEN